MVCSCSPRLLQEGRGERWWKEEEEGGGGVRRGHTEGRRIGPGWMGSCLPEDYHVVPHFLVAKEPEQNRRFYSTLRPRTHAPLMNYTPTHQDTPPNHLTSTKNRIKTIANEDDADQRSFESLAVTEGGRAFRARDWGPIFPTLRQGKGYMSLFSTLVRGCIMRVTDGWLMILMGA